MSRNHKNSTAEREVYIRRLLGQISDTNRPAAEEFDLTKIGQGARVNTRYLYARALAALDAAVSGKPWREIDHLDAAGFMAAQRLAGYADDSIITTASYCKAFLKWLRDEAQLPPKLLGAFRVRRNRHLPDRPVVTEEEQQELMHAAKNLRDQVIIAMLTEGGMRVTELRLLRVGDPTFNDRGVVWVQLPPPQDGLKTGTRRFPIARYAMLLHAYLSTHPARDDPEAPLIAPYDRKGQLRAGKGLGQTGLWTAISRLRKAAGIRHFRPHDLRHTGITRASENGVQGVALSERFWGVPNSRQVARYVHHSDLHKERIARLAAGIDPNGDTVQPGKKTCPSCAEEIKAAAVKCRYCGESVAPNGRPLDSPKT